MGGKNNTKTGTSNQTYTPAGASQLQEIWNRVQSAASTPYTPYGGQMVAGLNQTQRGGIDKIVGATGDLDTARGYATSGAAAIEPGEIERYYNPFQRDVIEATQRNFAESNAQADERMKGNSIARGAWGGDRANIGRSELMRSQKIAQDPVIAGLNSQGFNLALAAAQADRAAKAQGGYQFGALHNSALAGGQSQIGAGSLEQGTDQARLNAAYQQYLQAQAFPYQQAQFMASTGLPTVSAMGGSQSGSSTSPTPGPSPLSQIAGLGLTAASIFGAPFTGGASLAGVGAGASMMGAGNKAARGGRISMSRGGRTRPRGFDHGGFVERVQSIREMLRGGRVMEASRDPNGIYVPHGFADGGDVGFNDRWGGFPVFDAGDGAGSMEAARGIMGLQDVPPAAMDAWRRSSDVAASDIIGPGDVPPSYAGLPPIMRPTPMPMPVEALGYSGAPARGPGLSAPPMMVAPEAAGPSPFARPAPAEAPSGGGGLFNLSEDSRLGMLSAGLGMMASNNPSALGAIGEGGLQGVKQYADAKKSKQSNEIQARKLIQDAEQFAKGIDLREKTLKETERYHNIVGEDRKETVAERKRAAQERSDDRRDAASRTAYPGEGLDGEGKTVKGLYQFNPDTREYDFKPGKVIQKGAGSGAAKEGQTERLIKQLKEENPNLTTAEAIALTKRAPDGDQMAIRRESLALSAAKADLGYLRDPSGTLEKWRKQYGLGAAPAAPGATAPAAAPKPPPAATAAPPPRPATVPPGSQYSPSRKMWRDPSGKIYDAAGNPVQ